MSWEYCRKCGEKRKVDIALDAKGWQQPQCYSCGDPGYYEVFNEDGSMPESRIWVTAKNQEWAAQVTGLSLDQIKGLYHEARKNKVICTIVVKEKRNNG